MAMPCFLHCRRQRTVVHTHACDLQPMCRLGTVHLTPRGSGHRAHRRMGSPGSVWEVLGSFLGPFPGLWGPPGSQDPGRQQHLPSPRYLPFCRSRSVERTSEGGGRRQAADAAGPTGQGGPADPGDQGIEGPRARARRRGGEDRRAAASSSSRGPAARRGGPEEGAGASSAGDVSSISRGRSSEVFGWSSAVFGGFRRPLEAPEGSPEAPRGPRRFSIFC